MEFCTKLLEEIENFKNTGIPTARPNSMNYYGAVYVEMRFTEFFKQLREDYLSLFTSILYKDYSGEKLNSHHAFAINLKLNNEDFEFKHIPGVALIHIGVHRHGALGLTIRVKIRIINNNNNIVHSNKHLYIRFNNSLKGL
ncbi:hypothetical protein ACTFIT_002370 [Dictyostelium discoideum]